MTSKDHVLVQPFFLLVLRFVQAVVGVVILGLTGYGVTKFAFDGDSLMLFTVRSLVAQSPSVTNKSPGPRHNNHRCLYHCCRYGCPNHLQLLGDFGS